MKPLRVHGLPLHPLLVHFPVAGWSAATFLLIAVAFGAGPVFVQAAYWCNVAALATGLAAVIVGFIEAVALPKGAAIRDVAARHMLFATSAWTAYLVALLLQYKQMNLAATITTVIGFALLLLAGHAGARLVYPHGLPEHADIT